MKVAAPTFVCEPCGVHFATYILIRRHILAEHRQPARNRQHDDSATSTTTTPRQPRRHRSTVKRHQCDECGLLFLTPGQLRQHSHRHTGERPFACARCPAAFASQLGLTLHETRHHAARRVPAAHVCPVCARVFYDGSTMRVHQRQHTGEEPYACTLCDRRTKQAQNLKSHYLHAHKVVESSQAIRARARPYFEAIRSDETAARDTDDDDDEVSAQSNAVEPLALTVPIESTSQQPFLEIQLIKGEADATANDNGDEDVFDYDHISVKAESPSHYDDDNAADDADIDDQKTPMKSETTTAPVKAADSPSPDDPPLLDIVTFECYHCHGFFEEERSLQAHMRTAHRLPRAANAPAPSKPTKRYRQPGVCDMCGLQFASRSQMATHRTHAHSDARPFGCAECPQRFKTGSALNKHRAKHTDVRPFACAACPLRFKTGDCLRQHSRRVHPAGSGGDGERPRLTCADCGKTYCDAYSLRLHVHGVHTGERPYACRHCEARFADPSAWRQHERIHTGELPYRCHLCGKGCTQAGNLKSHLRHFHRIATKGVRQKDLVLLREPTTRATTKAPAGDGEG